MIVQLGDAAIRANPYPTYARLRATTPVVRATVPAMGQVWLVTRYHDVVRVLRDPLLTADRLLDAAGQRADAGGLPRLATLIANSLVMHDGPEHTRLRSLVHHAFTPRSVERLAGRVQQYCDALLARLGGHQVADLVAGLAVQVPLLVLCDLFGVPAADRERFRHWCSRYIEASASGMARMVLLAPESELLLRYLEHLIALRRVEPADDLVSALVAADVAGDRLRDDEVLSMLLLLLISHETTVNLIANGTVALLDHPAQLARLRERPELIDVAVEELLRYAAPAEFGTKRIARRAFELGGVAIERGDHVVALLSSANRDEAVFTQPERLDLTRHPNRHIAFGYGVHYCLGAPLARLEGRIAILSLVRRFPALRLAVPREQLRWTASVAVRGLHELPVALC